MLRRSNVGIQDAEEECRSASKLREVLLANICTGTIANHAIITMAKRASIPPNSVSSNWLKSKWRVCYEE